MTMASVYITFSAIKSIANLQAFEYHERALG